MTTIHKVKSWPQFFEATLLGAKTHDLRYIKERNYTVGDTMCLQEFNPFKEEYTGRELLVKITYITSAESTCALSNSGLDPEFCILSITKL